MHKYSWLVLYHEVVMDEMWKRGYHVAPEWKDCYYHGKELGIIKTDSYNQDSLNDELAWMAETGVPVYAEHDDAYLRECIDLLKQKNAPMDFEKIERELL